MRAENLVAPYVTPLYQLIHTSFLTGLPSPNDRLSNYDRGFDRAKIVTRREPGATNVFAPMK